MLESDHNDDASSAEMTSSDVTDMLVALLNDSQADAHVCSRGQNWFVLTVGDERFTVRTEQLRNLIW